MEVHMHFNTVVYTHFNTDVYMHLVSSQENDGKSMTWKQPE
jgi:hypothetical protein